ncbi:anti-sigma factor [Streptomyces sp. CB00455]|uniref:anti-sigma factor n=1 Tax=Streptomyces sp. CB00455 TaxID=1703927 RepID=UPI0009392748|nr:anti-sigma factor [Streptomyces sp. CB00455]OKK22249.1 anti-sigma factor [Streptomyces sp. CB00455]
MKHEADLHTLTGAYALDALTGEEHEAFSAHLAHCASCLQEVAGFAATSARLAAAVAVPAPPGMKQTVLRRIDTVRRLPPHTRAAKPARLAAVLTRRTGPFVIAACVAAATAFGGLAAWQHQQADQARLAARHAERQVRDLAAVMAAPDARTVHGRTSGGAAASVVTSARLNKSVFVGSGMPAAPAGKAYQLWFDDHGTMRPAGLLRHDGAVLMDGDPGRARAVGLTLEPAGGSPRPTTAPLMLLNLPA